VEKEDAVNPQRREELFMYQKIKALNLWRQKGIIVYTAAVCLLLIFCVVTLLLPKAEYEYQGTYRFETGTASTDTVVYEGISLKPGVYEVSLAYRTDTDYSAICSVKDDTVHHRALLTNGEHCYKGLAETSYDMWLFEPTDNLQIVVSYGGEGALETGDLVVSDTGKLWSMLLVLVLFAAAAGYALLVAVCYNRQYGISSGAKKVFFFLAVITFLASLPQLRGFVLGGADLTYHLQRIEGVKDGLLSGQFPVRLEPEWLYGHGYADGVFYCNALLYFPALLRLAGFTVTTSYNVFCILLNLATAVIAWYCFSRIFEDDNIGLMCSALYTLSVIRIYKLDITGALGEGSAITFLPLVFYGMYRVLTEDTNEKSYRTAWLPVAFGYAGLMQTHVLTCEITAFLTLIVCVVCIRRIVKLPVFCALAKGALGALGLSLWYLVPFADYYLTQDMHIRHVSGRTIQERGLYFAQLFVNSWSQSVQETLESKGLVGVEPVSPGLLCMVGLGIFLVLWLCGRLRHRRLSQRYSVQVPAAKFSAVLACLLLFMTLKIFPWDWIQEQNAVAASLVSSLQFPNRFLGWAMVFLVMVFGFCVWYCKMVFGDRQTKRGAACVLTVAGIFTVASVLTCSLYLIRHSLTEQNHYTLYNEEGMGFGYISGAEYLVQGTDDSLLTFTGPAAGADVTIKSYDKRYLHAWLSCANTGETESYVELPILLYKGYRAYTADGQELTICDGDNHLVRVLLPAGFDGTLEVRFVSPFYWRISEIVSLIAWAIVAVSCVRCAKENRENRKCNQILTK
jgi:hypothetical protein